MNRGNSGSVAWCVIGAVALSVACAGKSKKRAGARDDGSGGDGDVPTGGITSGDGGSGVGGRGGTSGAGGVAARAGGPGDAGGSGEGDGGSENGGTGGGDAGARERGGSGGNIAGNGSIAGDGGAGIGGFAGGGAPPSGGNGGGSAGTVPADCPAEAPESGIHCYGYQPLQRPCSYGAMNCFCPPIMDARWYCTMCSSPPSDGMPCTSGESVGRCGYPTCTCSFVRYDEGNVPLYEWDCAP